jgi:hypothetical protein
MSTVLWLASMFTALAAYLATNAILLAIGLQMEIIMDRPDGLQTNAGGR